MCSHPNDKVRTTRLTNHVIRTCTVCKLRVGQIPLLRGRPLLILVSP